MKNPRLASHDSAHRILLEPIIADSVGRLQLLLPQVGVALQRLTHQRLQGSAVSLVSLACCRRLSVQLRVGISQAEEAVVCGVTQALIGEDRCWG